MIDSRRLTARIVVGAIAITSLFAGVPTISADEVSDQKQVVEQLAAELDRLTERIATLDEEYGGAQDEQAELDIEIAASREKVAGENAKLALLQETMTEIAVNRFVGGDSMSLSPLFSSATSYNDAQQMDALSSIALDTGDGTADELDSVLRTLDAEVANLERQEQEAADLVAYLDAKLAEGEKLIEEYTTKAAEAKAKYGELVQEEAERQMELRAQQAAQAVAAAEAQAAANAAAANTAANSAAPAAAAPRGGGTTAVPTSGGGTTPAAAPSTPVVAPKPVIPQPPPVSGKAGIAVAAAYSQLGVPYIAFRATPGVGFDCSGLTMYAWAQAGVSIPHQSGRQFATNPRVPKDQAQAGDLVFFYSPISHVGIYVGNGMMIDAPNTGSFVRLKAVNWGTVVGVSRPGT